LLDKQMCNSPFAVLNEQAQALQQQLTETVASAASAVAAKKAAVARCGELEREIRDFEKARERK
jgi:hypothetical protein